MLFPQDCLGVFWYFFSFLVNPDHSTEPEKGMVPPTAKVAKLKAEGGFVAKVGNT